jgi:hypothetical protein
MTKDVDVLQAKLRAFDYYFMPHPYNNHYNDELLTLESKIESLNVDLHVAVERNKKARRILAFAGPGSIILFTVVGFVGGFRLRSRINL